VVEIPFDVAVFGCDEGVAEFFSMLASKRVASIRNFDASAATITIGSRFVLDDGAGVGDGWFDSGPAFSNAAIIPEMRLFRLCAVT
jgi:hypothetical protein